MRICAQGITKGAPIDEQKELRKQQKAAQLRFANGAVNCSVSADVRKHSSEKKLYNKNTAVYNEKNGSGGRKCYAGII